ncbi:MAG: hypothetical protein ACI9J4_000262 [Paraglaciecola sp.]
MKFCFYIQIVLLLQISPAFTAERVAKPQFRMSFGAGADRKPFVELMQTIYEELGFKVSTVPTPAKRGIMLLNNGLVDADVIRLKRTVVKYKNVIIVEPALGKGYLVLICHKGIPCDLSVLKNKTVQINSHAGILNLFDIGELNAQIIISEMTTNTLHMMHKGRVFYSLYTMDEPMLRALSPNLNYIKIKVVYGYHVINKKHAHLVPKIQQKLRQKLPAFTATRV